MTVPLEQRVLARNDELARRNREWLARRDVLAVNLMSSPGSGKTTLLERTIRELAGDPVVSVVEGDQETAFDAERIRATGCRARWRRHSPEPLRACRSSASTTWRRPGRRSTFGAPPWPAATRSLPDGRP